MKRYHLERDIGFRKEALRRNWRDTARKLNSDDELARGLIFRRDTSYTLDELNLISKYFTAPHHRLCRNTPNKFNSFERRIYGQAYAMAERALTKLHDLNQDKRSQVPIDRAYFEHTR